MITIVLLIAALVCFLLDAFNLPVRIKVGWLGAALATVAFIIYIWPGVNA